MLSKRYSSKSTEIRTYKTVIRPMTLYGSETLTLRKNGIPSDDLGKKIYGPKCKQEVWKIKKNLELQNAYK
jgi:hypothetical protein